jgi:pyruvate/2-oxoglutarate dehydrogenase complex dihydrolipoamide acyltransferase (E2) component
MPAEITMPKLGLTMTTGTIVRWLKAPGDRIFVGEPLLEVSTDKISYEVESPVAGMLAQTLGAEGDEFAPGAIIGLVSDETAVPSIQAHATPIAALELQTVASEPAAAEQAAAEHAAAEHAAAEHAATSEGLANADSVVEAPSQPERTPASPAARRLARELGVELGAVNGSGPGGRVTLDDVAAAEHVANRNVVMPPGAQTPAAQSPAARRPAAQSPATQTPAAQLAPVELPAQLPAARRTIFRRMTEIGALPLAQVETTTRVDALHALIQRRGDVGWTAFVVFAAARLLLDYPVLRTDARTGAPHPRCDVGVAADTPHGLLVPVVRDAATRSLRSVQDEIARLAGAAREGRLSPNDVGEAAFTVSNVGPQGIERVVPLVDPPQTAILGVGAAGRRPAVVTQPGAQEDVVVPAWTLTLVLSFDHRFIDGAPAARFLAALSTALMDPGILL